jgi:hypothetical protein
MTKDLTVWKCVLGGIILCDILHLYASWCELGSVVFFNVAAWRKEEWVNYGLLYGPMVLRACFLGEVGLRRRDSVTVKKVR